ncbi:LAFA_0G23728g1_1 [Lachancea sp. 'fantastica']|nr:LAFA_0G23728g1_1 [Lachancea sp. 'fantastica']
MKFLSYIILATCVSEVLGGSGALGGYDGKSSSKVDSKSSASSPSGSQSLRLVQTSNVEGGSATKSTVQTTTAMESATPTNSGGPVAVVTTHNSAGETYLSTVWWSNSVTRWWTPASELTLTSSSSTASIESSSSSSTQSTSSASVKNATNAAPRIEHGTGLGAGAWILAIGVMAL